MLAVADARNRLLELIQPLEGQEVVAVGAANGRYGAADAWARISSPPFDNSAMDGYAVRRADLAEEGGALPIALTVTAGDDPDPLPAGGCARIMTGAPVPTGADAVVMQERVVTDAGVARFEMRPPEGANIRRAGEDMAAGTVVVQQGERIGPPQIAALATAGVEQVAVARRPRVLVLSTGSELRDPEQAGTVGTIPDSNRPAILARLADLGAEPVDGGRVADDPDALRAALAQAEGVDAVVTTGGVSVGDLDHVRSVLDEVGEIALWRVAIKPGKPFAFGRILGAWLFGLPGNPVSALVTLEQFVRPGLIRLMGGAPTSVRISAEAGAAFHRSKTERTEYVRARLEWQAGRLLAHPLTRQGSGMVGGMSRAHGFIIVEAGTYGFAAGESVAVEPVNEWCRFGEPQSRGEE